MLTSVAAAGSTVVGSGQLKAQQYLGRLIDLGSIAEGDTMGFVINDSNMVAGVSGDRGFVWAPEIGMQDLGDLGGGSTKGYNINGRGLVVGESVTENGDTHAFSYFNGDMRDLGTLGGDYSTAEEANSLGIIVGASKDAEGVQHAYLNYPDRGMVRLPNLGGGEAYGVSVNAFGQVCGISETENGETHAFIYDAERGITDLGTLGGTYCEGWQINDQGVACGISQTENGATHGFVWIPDERNGTVGRMIDIGAYNGTGTVANFVSDDGVILAMTEDEDIPLIANLTGDGPSVSATILNNPFYSASLLEAGRAGFSDGMRIQAPCAMNILGAITGWGVSKGSRRAYVLLPST